MELKDERKASLRQSAKGKVRGKGREGGGDGENGGNEEWDKGPSGEVESEWRPSLPRLSRNGDPHCRDLGKIKPTDPLRLAKRSA